jgi:hypothetical protein
MGQGDVTLTQLDGPLALALGFPMQEGGAQGQPGQPLGILGGSSIGAADTHERGDLLHPGGSGSLRLESQRRVGGMPIVPASRAPAVSPFEVERAKDGVQSAGTLFGFGLQGFPADRAPERLCSGQALGARPQDRQHQLSGLGFQEFFQVTEGDVGSLEQGAEAGLGGLRPGDEGVVWNEWGVDSIGYHIYDTG